MQSKCKDIMKQAQEFIHNMEKIHGLIVLKINVLSQNTYTVLSYVFKITAKICHLYWDMIM